jgi:uncharacterized membrane protein YhhN
MPAALTVGLTLFAVAGLLVAEYRGARRGVWIWKPLASSGFVASAVAAGALHDTSGRVVVLALFLCLLGDVLLIPDDPRAFRAGVLSFLGGHLAYAAAFLIRGIDAGFAAVALVAVAAAASITVARLKPHLPDGMVGPVTAYVGAISVMVACAIGTAWARPAPAIPVGALAFFLSDLSVARDRFVVASFANRAWGLPLYYVAQLLLATSGGR